MPPNAPSSIAPNYRYWREHGGEWGAEYESRKKRFLYYHVQEAMLCDYFLHAAPARVLEYGCGVGRHLRYLSALPGLDVYGYDQSQAMVDNCLAWATPEWVRAHVAVGAPTGRLPYPDGHFDIVFTSEVLVHVRPDDLPGLLRELVRIARRQIFHMEPAPAARLVSDYHDGCWSHDLAAAYAALGHTVELLPAGYECQAPYRVRLDPAASVYSWPEPVLALYRRMEGDIQPEIFALHYLREEMQTARQQVVTLEAQADSLHARLDLAAKEAAALARQAETASAELAQERRRLAELGGRAAALEARLDASEGERRDLTRILAGQEERAAGLDAQLALARGEARGLRDRVVELEAVVDERENRLRTVSTLTKDYFRLLLRKSAEYALHPRRTIAKILPRPRSGNRG